MLISFKFVVLNELEIYLEVLWPIKKHDNLILKKIMRQISLLIVTWDEDWNLDISG